MDGMNQNGMNQNGMNPGEQLSLVKDVKQTNLQESVPVEAEHQQKEGQMNQQMSYDAEGLQVNGLFRLRDKMELKKLYQRSEELKDVDTLTEQEKKEISDSGSKFHKAEREKTRQRILQDKKRQYAASKTAIADHIRQMNDDSVHMSGDERNAEIGVNKLLAMKETLHAKQSFLETIIQEETHKGMASAEEKLGPVINKMSVAAHMLDAISNFSDEKIDPKAPEDEMKAKVTVMRTITCKAIKSIKEAGDGLQNALPEFKDREADLLSVKSAMTLQEDSLLDGIDHLSGEVQNVLDSHEQNVTFGMALLRGKQIHVIDAQDQEDERVQDTSSVLHIIKENDKTYYSKPDEGDFNGLYMKAYEKHVFSNKELREKITPERFEKFVNILFEQYVKDHPMKDSGALGASRHLKASLEDYPAFRDKDTINDIVKNGIYGDSDQIEIVLNPDYNGDDVENLTKEQMEKEMHSKYIHTDDAGHPKYKETHVSKRRFYHYEVAEVDEMQQILQELGVNMTSKVYKTALKIEKQSNTKRNIATTAVAEVLKVNEIVAKSKEVKVVTKGGSFVGSAMEEVKGVQGEKLGGELVNVPGFHIQTCANENATRQLVTLQLFDAICGQTDRHYSNMVYTVSGTQITGIKAIDNDMSFGNTDTLTKESFNSIPVLKKVKDGKEEHYEFTIPYLPKEFLHTIRETPVEAFQAAAGKYISEDNMKALITRVQVMKDAVAYAEDHQDKIQSKLVGKDEWTSEMSSELITHEEKVTDANADFQDLDAYHYKLKERDLGDKMLKSKSYFRALVNYNRLQKEKDKVGVIRKNPAARFGDQTYINDMGYSTDINKSDIQPMENTKQFDQSMHDQLEKEKTILK